jgi:hypothetical protein
MVSDIQVFSKINNLYNNTTQQSHNAHFYGTYRQNNHASAESFLPMFLTLTNKGGLNKFLDYTLNMPNTSSDNVSSNSRVIKDLIGYQNVFNLNSESSKDLNSPSIFFKNRLLLDEGDKNPNLFFLK